MLKLFFRNRRDKGDYYNEINDIIHTVHVFCDRAICPDDIVGESF